jgi:hypothetical protein
VNINKENLTFGQRFGMESIEVPFQVKGIDRPLRNQLLNTYFIYFFNPLVQAYGYEKDNHMEFQKTIWMDILRERADEFELAKIKYSISRIFEKEAFHKVYGFLEDLLRYTSMFINQYSKKPYYDLENIVNYINRVLIENHSGYSLLNNVFIEITNYEEISELEKLNANSHKHELNNIRIHFKNSIDLFAKKPNPDYANSIKESISMVEAISSIIEPKGKTLGDALSKIESSEIIKMHPGLKSGFSSIYGYVSDGDGIRHALKIDVEQKLDAEDARFFLVSCSAFTNYLIEKASKAGVLKNESI